MVFEPKRVDLQLKDCDGVSKLKRLDCTKENVAAAAIIEVEVELLLEAEIEEELLR